jgi:hypothetical protein
MRLIMKNLILASALSISLAACATVPGSQPTTGGGRPDVTAIISQVQAAATTACKFLPTASTALAVIGTFTDVSGFVPIADIAAAICNSVTSRSASRGGPRVRGVAIKGRFVR